MSAPVLGPPEPVRIRGADGIVQVRPLRPRSHVALFARLLLAPAPAGSWLHVWPARRRPDGRLVAYRRGPEAWVPAGEPDAFVAQAGVWHGRGMEVFAGLLPRHAARPDRDAVAPGQLVWVDVDDPARLDRLHAFCAQRPAHYQAASGGSGGRHAAWLLDRAHDPAAIARATRRLAAAVGGDVAVCHAGASLRLPGTRNRKPAGGWCRIVEADLRLAPYRLDALCAGLAEPERPAAGSSGRTPATRTVIGRRAPARDELAAIAPPAYFAALCGVAVPAEGGLVSCPLPGHEDEHPSCMVYRDPARGWRCFSHPGGPLGGRLYDLASALAGGPTGYALRGQDFLSARAAARARLDAGSPSRAPEARSRADATRAQPAV